MHNDYPLAPKKFEISPCKLLKHCSSIADQYSINVGGVNELVPDLSSKKKYVPHYRNLQLYFSLGIKLIGVHSFEVESI